MARALRQKRPLANEDSSIPLRPAPCQESAPISLRSPLRREMSLSGLSLIGEPQVIAGHVDQQARSRNRHGAACSQGGRTMSNVINFVPRWKRNLKRTGDRLRDAMAEDLALLDEEIERTVLQQTGRCPTTARVVPFNPRQKR